MSTLMVQTSPMNYFRKAAPVNLARMFGTLALLFGLLSTSASALQIKSYTMGDLTVVFEYGDNFCALNKRGSDYEQYMFKSAADLQMGVGNQLIAAAVLCSAHRKLRNNEETSLGRWSILFMKHNTPTGLIEKRARVSQSKFNNYYSKNCSTKLSKSKQALVDEALSKIGQKLVSTVDLYCNIDEHGFYKALIQETNDSGKLAQFSGSTNVHGHIIHYIAYSSLSHEPAEFDLLSKHVRDVISRIRTKSSVRGKKGFAGDDEESTLGFWARIFGTAAIEESLESILPGRRRGN